MGSTGQQDIRKESDTEYPADRTCGSGVFGINVDAYVLVGCGEGRRVLVLSATVGQARGMHVGVLVGEELCRPGVGISLIRHCSRNSTVKTR